MSISDVTIYLNGIGQPQHFYGVSEALVLAITDGLRDEPNGDGSVRFIDGGTTTIIPIRAIAMMAVHSNA